MVHGLIVYADIVGCDPITPKNGKKFTLEECYETIGCDIVEIVRVPDLSVRADGKPCILIVDEEGALNDSHYNRYASALAGRTIVGNAILCPETMF